MSEALGLDRRLEPDPDKLKFCFVFTDCCFYWDPSGNHRLIILLVLSHPLVIMQ